MPPIFLPLLTSFPLPAAPATSPRHLVAEIGGTKKGRTWPLNIVIFRIPGAQPTHIDENGVTYPGMDLP